MIMFRFAQIFVLIVGMAWIVELTHSYLKKHRKLNHARETARECGNARTLGD